MTINDLSEQSQLDKDPLAVFREQVKAEKKTRGHMSETALANFQAIKVQDKADAVAGERLKSALASIVPTPDNLAKLIQKCETAPTDTGHSLGPKFEATKVVKPMLQLARRVHKLSWWIDAGYLLGREIDSLYMVGFFSRLVGDEFTMSDGKFASIWDIASARKLKASRIRQTTVKTKKPPRRSLEYRQTQMLKRQEPTAI
jgi:hypothetical protein